MNPVGELLGRDDIQLDVDVPDKARLLQRIAALLARRLGLTDTDVLESLTVREQMGSTGLGQRCDSARADASVRRSSRGIRANEVSHSLRCARSQTRFALSGADRSEAGHRTPLCKQGVLPAAQVHCKEQ
jgi:hypothetical protein